MEDATLSSRTRQHLRKIADLLLADAVNAAGSPRAFAGDVSSDQNANLLVEVEHLLDGTTMVAVKIAMEDDDGLR